MGQGGPAQLREVAGTPSAKGRPKKVTYKTFMYCIYNEGKGYLNRGVSVQREVADTPSANGRPTKVVYKTFILQQYTIYFG